MVELDSSRFSDLKSYIQQLIESNQPNINEIVHAEVDKVLYEQVLNHVAGHQTQAAEILGISRTSFRSRLQSFGRGIGKALKSGEE